MKKLQAFLTLCLAVLLLATVFPAGAFASEGGPGFLVEPVYPENQLEHGGFFDLRVEPGVSQELVLAVRNDGDQSIEVEVEVVNASTAPYGFIDYATAGIADESLRYPLESLTAVEQPLVEVPAGGQAEVAVTLTAPDERFDGVILGAVRVLKRSAEPSDAMIANQYQYAIAVKLTSDGEDVAPDFELVDVSVGLENYRAAVVASVRNPMPAMAKGIDVTAELISGGEQVFGMERSVDMAPSSVWDCQLVDEAGYGFPAGEYLLRMRLEHDGGVWEFERAFTISGGEAEYINSNAVNQQQVQRGGFPVWATILCVAGGLLIVLVLILLVTLLKRSKDNRESV